MAQDPHRPADGQQKKLPRTGDLIITREGTPLVVLGRPSMKEPGPDEKWYHMFRGTLVVLMPSGLPGLHVPEVGEGRPDFIHHWVWGWEPIGDETDEEEREIQEAERARARTWRKPG
jgi:hypothetical protein